MKKSSLFLTYVTAFAVASWIGFSAFNYFTYSQSPHVVLKGITQNGHYGGIIPCTLSGVNSYKIAQTRVLVDGVPVEKYHGLKVFERPFQIDTSTLAQGKHTVRIEAIDASYKRNTSTQEFEFYVDNHPLKATFMQPEYSVDQGRTIHVQIQASKILNTAEVAFSSQTYECVQESENSTIYECFIPTDCQETPNEYLLTAQLKDLTGNQLSLSSKVKVKQFAFKQARGFSIAKNKLEDEKELSMSNKALSDALEKWTQDSPHKKLWTGQFIPPCEIQRITTPFGEIRTTSEKGRYHHAAVDITNIPKSVIWACQDGTVIIKDRFLLSGNVVAIDHGMGIISLYCHLEDFAHINVGDPIKKGEPLGRLGMTGYASGPHLHWALRVKNKEVDPLQWTEKTF